MTEDFKSESLLCADLRRHLLRLDGNLQKLQVMWQTLFVDMKSLLSWQYLMRDIHIIKTWNVTMVTTLKHTYCSSNLLFTRVGDLNPTLPNSVRPVQDPEGGGVPAGAEEPGAALPGLPERQPGLPNVRRRGPNAGGVQLQRRQPALQHHGQHCRAR